MELTRDILLRGQEWRIAVEKYASIFAKRTNYDVYMMALPIGIMFDKRIEKLEDEGEALSPITVPRNVITNNDNGKIDLFFQTAILTTKTENLTEEERLEIAFGEKTEFNKLNFLTEFANYGVTKLVGFIGDTDIETIENLKNFLTSTIEGNNFDIDRLPDEILLDL